MPVFVRCSKAVTMNDDPWHLNDQTIRPVLASLRIELHCHLVYEGREYRRGYALEQKAIVLRL
jgi:hypothetical protein